jgi:hypothetical protein
MPPRYHNRGSRGHLGRHFNYLQELGSGNMIRTTDTRGRKLKTRITSFDCGPVQLDYVGRTTIRGHTFTGEKTSGTAVIYRATIAEEEYLDIAYAVWSTGERDVRALEVESSRRALRRLEHGLRLGVERHSSELSVVELRQARIRYDDLRQWSNLFKASRRELRDGAGVDVGRILRRAGTIDVGTKQDVLGEFGRHREFLCATFQRNAQWPPVVAYVLTRVLPLMRGYTHDD